jgi:putative DNA primase/helicase
MSRVPIDADLRNWNPVDGGLGEYRGNGQPHDKPLVEPVLVNLASVEQKEVRWLWPGRIPLGKLTVVAGEPGLGKSQLSLDVAARVTTGNPWPDGRGINQVGSVVLLSAEDDVEDTIAPRLVAAGAGLHRITMVQGVEVAIDDSTKKRRCFSLQSDLPALGEAIESFPDTRLVVVDPLSAYLGDSNSHKDAEIRALLAPLADLAGKHGVAVLGVMHLNKNAGGKALHRVSGSLAFVAAARAAWLVSEDKANPKRRLFLPVKNNLAANGGGLAFGIVTGENGQPCLAWEIGEVNVSADEALEEDRENNEPRQQETIWLADLLKDGPIITSEMQTEARSAGFSWSTIRRVANDLGVESFKSGFGRSGKWSWRLPAKNSQPSYHTDNVSILGESAF